MSDRWKRLRKRARTARFAGLGMFFMALIAALVYSFFGAAQAGTP